MRRHTSKILPLVLAATSLFAVAEEAGARTASAQGEKQTIKVANTDPYVGSYEVAPGTVLEVTDENGTLFLQPPGQGPVPLEAYDDGTFGIPMAGATIKFTGNAQTGFTGLVLTQGANVTRATKKINAGGAAPPQEEELPRGGRTRADVLAELPDAERAFRRNPNDADAGLNYGRLLFESGEFWLARDIIVPLSESSAVSTETLNMAAKLQYLTGRYDDAAALYHRVREAKADDPGGQVMADVNRLFSYYQQDRFDKINEIEFPDGVQLPNATVAGEFQQNPYRLEWHNDEKRSVVPFYVTDPLPVFAIEVNGVPIEVIFDTGGDMLILDTEIAEALGIESVATAMGTFGGGLQSEIGFGKVDRVQVGDVTMHGVPVTILPTKRFSSGFEPYRIGGILGTAVMRQFLGTLDYENEQLVLRERSPSNATALRQQLGDRLAAEIPFVLDQTHLMMARGGINGKEGLTYFIDSGLASENMLTAPIQTLQYLGIPVPETEMPAEGVGGGGGRWASGRFAMESVSLGTLVQTDASGEYGSRMPGSYWTEFYIQDALLSHRFLRQHASWTLNFDNMTYVFERENLTR